MTKQYTKNYLSAPVANSHCFVCRSDDLRLFDLPYPSIVPLNYRLNGTQNASIKLCAACGTIFRNGDPSAIAYYSSEEDAENYDSIVSVYSPEDGGYVNNHFVMSRYLDDLIIPPSPRLLDVGCGNGMFLKEVAARFTNYELSGFDVSENLQSQFEDHHRIDYHFGNLRDVPNKFDAITFIDSLSFILDIPELFEIFESKLADDGVIFVTSPDISKNNVTLLMDTQHYYFTFSSLQSLFGHFGYVFTEINVSDVFPRHVFGYSQKGKRGSAKPSVQTAQILQDAASYMKRLKRKLSRLADWWDNSVSDGMRLGVLGTKHNAAITLHTLSDRATLVVDETEEMVGDDFHGRNIFHPRELTEQDIVILPYGPSAKSIRERFKQRYKGRFICL